MHLFWKMNRRINQITTYQCEKCLSINLVTFCLSWKGRNTYPFIVPRKKISHSRFMSCQEFLQQDDKYIVDFVVTMHGQNNKIVTVKCAFRENLPWKLPQHQLQCQNLEVEWNQKTSSCVVIPKHTWYKTIMNKNITRIKLKNM